MESKHQWMELDEYDSEDRCYKKVLKTAYFKEDFEELKNALRERVISPTNDMVGDFAFYKGVTYARSLFPVDFPQFKLARKNIKYLIITKEHLKETAYFHPCIQVRDGVYTISYKSGVSESEKFSLSHPGYLTHIPSITEEINKKNPDMQLVYLEDLYTLKAQSGTELNEKLYNTIDSLLKSSDEDVKVGASMLSAVDYGKFSAHISFLAFKNWYPRLASMTKDVRMKTLIDRLETDYPQFKSAKWTTGSYNYLVDMVKRTNNKELLNRITEYVLNDKGIILERYENNRLEDRVPQTMRGAVRFLQGIGILEHS